MLISIIKSFIAKIRLRDEAYVKAHNNDGNQRYQRLASFVGWVAVLLPFVLLGTGFFLAQHCNYDSISHYYYSQWGAVAFVGMLCFLGTFFQVYPGENIYEGRLATFAGVLVIIVAIIPTNNRGCEDLSEHVGRAFVTVTDGAAAGDAPVITTSAEGVFDFGVSTGFSFLPTLHFAAAGIALMIMAFFSAIIFTRVRPDAHRDPATGELLPRKAIRNKIYLAAAWIIIGSILLIGVKDFFFSSEAWDRGNWTFKLESVALMAFGVSWLIRGRSKLFEILLVDDHEKRVTYS